MLLNHLLHAKSLAITAPEEGPLGQAEADRWGEVPLALKKKSKPFLESVRFYYIVICSQLTDILIDL